MDPTAPGMPLPPDALQAEELRLKLLDWRTDLVRRGRSTEVAPVLDEENTATPRGEWERYGAAEADFWKNHASKLPAGSRHTVQAPADYSWRLRGRTRCLKLRHPELADPPRAGERHPVPSAWLNEAFDLADALGITGQFDKPAGDVTPQHAPAMFDHLPRATDREIERRNGAMPWRGTRGLAAAARQFDRLADRSRDVARRAARAAHLAKPTSTNWQSEGAGSSTRRSTAARGTGSGLGHAAGSPPATCSCTRTTSA